MEVIIVSGTPGTGKTTVAKRLAEERGYRYIDVNKLIEDNGLAEGTVDGSRIVDTDRLNRCLIALIKESADKGLVIDSHLSHFLPKEYVGRCVITKCGLKELKKRLGKRGYPAKKVRENLDAEIFDVCRIEALEAGHNVEVIWTSGP